MSDKNFKVKNKVVVNGLTGGAGPVIADGSNVLDSVSNLPTQYGGTGTTTSPSSGQVLYSASGTTYSPTTFSTLPGVYARGNTDSRPASPTAGDLYYNTDYNYFESYTGTAWFPIAAAPGAPTGVTATNQPSGRAYNNGQMSVAFSPNTSAGAPSSYIVTPTPTTSPSTFTGSSSPVTVTGLASSTQYTYTVTATSPYGTSSASSASSGVTATTVPQAPTIETATAGISQATLTFTAGATGGSAITSYSITSNPATTTQTATSSPYTFTGLTNGTAYTFTVTATNANGTSTASSASSSVTPTAFSTTGSYDALATYTVGSGGASSITFAGLPTGGQYSHLQIRCIAKSDGSAGEDRASAQIRFNSDSSSNYASHYLKGNGTSATAGGITSQAQIDYAGLSWIPNSWSGYDYIWGVAVMDLLDYASTYKNKTLRVLSGYNSNGTNTTGNNISFTSGLWFKTPEAINSIQIICDQGRSFIQGSQFALYGVK